MKSNNLLLKVLIFLLLSTAYTNANQKIVYVDLQNILFSSIVGKELIDDINNFQNKKIKEFQKEQETLQDQEKKIISQKNILDEKKFNSEVKKLTARISDFNNKKKLFNDSLNKKKIEGRKQILDILNLILKDYALKNSISLILQKNNILLGENKINITEDIMKLLNKKIKKISLN
jgi:outer membrane protein